MKLIINIRDDWYRWAKNGSIDNGSMVAKGILDAIGEGSPLPRVHGRLIDAREYENSIRKHYFDNSTVIRCTEIALDNAPTIIEADGGMT